MENPKSEFEWMIELLKEWNENGIPEVKEIHRPAMLDKLNHGMLTDLPEAERLAEFRDMRTQAERLIKPR